MAVRGQRADGSQASRRRGGSVAAPWSAWRVAAQLEIRVDVRVGRILIAVLLAAGRAHGQPPGGGWLGIRWPPPQRVHSRRDCGKIAFEIPIRQEVT